MLLYFCSRHCSPCLVPYDAIVKLEMKGEENELLSQTELSNYVSSHQLTQWIHRTEGGTSSDLTEKYFKEIPCPLIIKLIKHFHMDLEMFQYDTIKYMKMCKNTD